MALPEGVIEGGQDVDCPIAQHVKILEESRTPAVDDFSKALAKVRITLHAGGSEQLGGFSESQLTLILETLDKLALILRRRMFDVASCLADVCVDPPSDIQADQDARDASTDGLVALNRHLNEVTRSLPTLLQTRYPRFFASQVDTVGDISGGTNGSVEALVSDGK